MIPRLLQRIKDGSGLFAFTDPEGKYHRGKTLWDLLCLIIVPVLLAIGVYWLNSQQNERENMLNLQQKESEKLAEEDRQRDLALQNYLASMSHLLIEEKLKDSHWGDPVRVVARSQTLATLQTLDPARQGLLVTFLFDAELIKKLPDTIVLLHKANLSEADLRGAILVETNLSYANLSGANLSGANLSVADGADPSGAGGADLSYANLSGADLTAAILTDAILRGANLNGAILKDANLSGAKYNERTQWPDGWDKEKLHEAGAELIE